MVRRETVPAVKGAHTLTFDATSNTACAFQSELFARPSTAIGVSRRLSAQSLAAIILPLVPGLAPASVRDLDRERGSVDLRPDASVLRVAVTVQIVDQPRIWYSESESEPNTIVRFDPKTEKFQSWPIPVEDTSCATLTSRKTAISCSPTAWSTP